MRWQGGRRSDNVEDRRGESPAYSAAGAAPVALRLLPMLLRTKVGRIILVTGIVVVIGGRMLGVDVLSLLAGGGVSSGQSSAPLSEADQQMAEFVSVVLGDTEDTWHPIFTQLGRDYREPTLVLFTGSVSSACGYATAAVGPFYCPGDQKLYIDLSFFQDLKNRHGAPGDFAQAYVIAHEVGHHVQTLLGISEKVAAAGKGANEARVNALSVRQELQADCFAGVWAHHAGNRNLLEAGDVEEAMRAASAIGDDTIQRRTQGRIVPDSFTHGSSEQRMRWFMTGMKSGQISACNTFEGNQI
jgi:uncharacterized protein